MVSYKDVINYLRSQLDNEHATTHTKTGNAEISEHQQYLKELIAGVKQQELELKADKSLLKDIRFDLGITNIKSAKQKIFLLYSQAQLNCRDYAEEIKALRRELHHSNCDKSKINKKIDDIKTNYTKQLKRKINLITLESTFRVHNTDDLLTAVETRTKRYRDFEKKAKKQEQKEVNARLNKLFK